MEKVNEDIQKTIERIKDEFNEALLSEEHYAGYLHDVNIKDIHQYQIDILLNLIKSSDQTIYEDGLSIGKVHVNANMPFEDLYYGYQLLGTLLDKFFQADWLQEHRLHERLNLQRNAVAEGYLNAYIDQLNEEVLVLIRHRHKVLSELHAHLVNTPLQWIHKILLFVLNPKSDLPAMESDRCPLTSDLEQSQLIDDQDKPMLLNLHEAQHVMGQSFMFFVERKNYPLAVFLLSRLYGRTLDLSNRIGLFLQLNTINELQKDALTGFYLRHDMETTIEHAMQSAIEKNTSLSMIMLDLDHFKKVNDQYGHPSGDQVLKQTAKLISQEIRLQDKVFRYGGEEFLILLENTDLEMARHIAERLRSRIEASDMDIQEEKPIRITASLGVQQFDGAQSEKMPKVRQFVSACDAKLYQAKEKGRNRIES